MEIVIKIPEWKYKSICEGVEASRRCGVVGVDPDIHEGIANGTPLPKGHGTLVDRSEVIKSLFDYHKGKKTLGQCIEDVQTIIEADWEDEEE